MRDPFSNYDAWLERPYQEMMEAGDDYADWAEEEGFDLDDPVQAKEAEEAFENYLEAMYEEDAVASYEAHLDRLEMEAEEVDYSEGW